MGNVANWDLFDIMFVHEDGYTNCLVSLGKGVVNLKDCYRAACELGIPYIMYEQDDDWVVNDPFRAVGESWAYLKSLSGEK